MLSIVIPTHNYGHYLRTALDSVRKQSFQDYEVLVVDDGSTDNTRELIAAYQWPELRYFYQTQQGPGAARNFGAIQSNGDHLIMLDADDHLLPGALTRFQTAIDSHPNHHIYIGGRTISDVDAVKKETRRQTISTRPEVNFANYLFGNLKLCQGRMAIKSECFANFQYPEHLRNGEDTALFAQLIANYSLMSFSDAVVNIVKHDDSQRHDLRAISETGQEQVDALFDPVKLPNWAMTYKNRYHAQWLTSLSTLHSKQGDVTRARELYRQAITVYPRSLLKISHWRRVC